MKPAGMCGSRRGTRNGTAPTGLLPSQKLIHVGLLPRLRESQCATLSPPPTDLRLRLYNLARRACRPDCLLSPLPPRRHVHHNRPLVRLRPQDHREGSLRRLQKRRLRREQHQEHNSHRQMRRVRPITPCAALRRPSHRSELKASSSIHLRVMALSLPSRPPAPGRPGVDSPPLVVSGALLRSQGRPRHLPHAAPPTPPSQTTDRWTSRVSSGRAPAELSFFGMSELRNRPSNRLVRNQRRTQNTSHTPANFFFSPSGSCPSRHFACRVIPRLDCWINF